MRKQTAIEIIEAMPKEFDLDLLLEKLVFMEKVEKGLKQAKNGQTIPHEKVKKMVKKWQV